MGAGIPLMVVNGEFQQDPGQQATLLLAFTAFMIVGAVIVAYRPGKASEVLTEHYRRAHPKALERPSR